MARTKKTARKSTARPSSRCRFVPRKVEYMPIVPVSEEPEDSEEMLPQEEEEHKVQLPEEPDEDPEEEEPEEDAMDTEAWRCAALR